MPTNGLKDPAPLLPPVEVCPREFWQDDCDCVVLVLKVIPAAYFGKIMNHPEMYKCWRYGDGLYVDEMVTLRRDQIIRLLEILDTDCLHPLEYGGDDAH